MCSPVWVHAAYHSDGCSEPPQRTVTTFMCRLCAFEFTVGRSATRHPPPLPHVKVGFCERTLVTSSPGAPTLHGPFPSSPSTPVLLDSTVNKSRFYDRCHLKVYFKKSIAPCIYLVISLVRLPPRGVEIVLYHRLFL